MNTVTTYKPPPKTVSISKGSFLNWITQYESLVVFGGFSIVILITIILTGIFQAGPVVRDNVLYNAFGALVMAAAFIYLIFSFMGSQIIILGKPIDVGMIIYIAIVLFVIFVLGN
jgi:hypothetical protein